MDKLKKMFSINKKIIVFFIGLLIIALIFGSSLALFLNENDKMLVTNYLKNFITNINTTNNTSLFVNGLFTNCSYGIFIWLLGISIIGIPIILLMFFSKCFILGFSVSSIIINYKVKGILFALIYIFPNQVINILIYGLLASYGIIFSLKIIYSLFNKTEFKINQAFKKYFKIFIISIITLLISNIYESFISPIIYKLIFDLLGL